MRKLLQRLTFLLVATSPFGFDAAFACVDYHPTPYTTATVDSNLQYMEIVVHNMHLFGGTSGEFCTCAITHYSDIYDQIYYVVFVDSATGLPEPGFAPWGSNSFASASWATFGGFDWNAYVATVTSGGLVAGKAVNLLIRATLPPGIQIIELDSILYESQLGTDAYDSTNHVVSNMHNSISGLGWTGQFEIVSPQYFTGITEVSASQRATVFPNPASDMATFMWSYADRVRTLRLYNAYGALLREVKITANDYRLFRNGLPAGVYSYRVTYENGLVEQGKLMFH